MLYLFHDLQQAFLAPAHFAMRAMQTACRNPRNPFNDTQAGRAASACAEVFERVTRRFERPGFGLQETRIGGEPCPVVETIVLDRPFCALTRFERDTRRRDPKVLLVAPMSGHYASLLRGTVEALLPHHDVHITDWKDARLIPPGEGRFDLDAYIAYLRDFMTLLGPDTHVVAVCQPAPLVYAAVALMEAADDPNRPRSMTLMGGPIDPRVSKTNVTELAGSRPLSWFEQTVTDEVPFYYPGGGRRVYPGFLQLSGFMSMNLDRHMDSHIKFFGHLVEGDEESAAAHRKFYDEYLSVMDLPAEFYLQTVETVFQNCDLPRGCMIWRDPVTGAMTPVDPMAIRRTALLTVEGELDDISAHGQTSAAHDLSVNLPAHLQYHHFQDDAGHYGIFNGHKWRAEIMPRLRHFIRQFDPDAEAVPEADLTGIPDLKAAQWDVSKHGIDALRERLANKAQATGRS